MNIAQSPMVIPCPDWRVDERVIVKIRHQPVAILMIKPESVPDEWRFLESYLQSYAFALPLTLNKEPIC